MKKVWIGPLMRLHKMRTSKCKCGSGLMVDQGLCVTSGAIIKLVFWCKVNILNTECEADRDMNSSDLDCLEVFIKFIFMERNDVINFTELLV